MTFRNRSNWIEVTNSTWRKVTAAAAALAVWLPAPALGQCTARWLYGPEQVMPGVTLSSGTASVNAMVNWDPDGDGPEGEWLVIAGEFDRAGTQVANDIAAWDGEGWRSLGTGTGGSGRVNALTVWNGRLVAGGTFTSMNGVTVGRIAQFDGAAWGTFNAGTAADANGTVSALCIYNGELVMAGSFTQVGRGNSTVSANRISRWSGIRWEPLGSGVTDGDVRVLADYGDDLIVGGSFTAAGGGAAARIARWNATTGSWTSMNSGLTAAVEALAVFEDRLIVGGEFSIVGPGALAAGRVAAWTAAGGWSALGDGFNNTVLDLHVHAGHLYAAGAFTASRAGTPAIRHSARWDGTAWQQVAEGFGVSAGVECLRSWAGSLHAGGSFRFDGGNVVCPGLAVLGESTNGWEPVTASFKFIPTSFAEYQGSLYAGARILSTAERPALGFAKWDGRTWESPTTFDMRSIFAMVEYNGELIVGGTFRTAVGGPAEFIAAWNGSTWRPLGAGLNGVVYSMCVFRGELIVGGRFTSAGGVPVNLIAKWNGVGWSALGTGMTESIGGVSPIVQTLVVHNDRLIAGGVFRRAGGTIVNHISQWNGSLWSAIGGGFSGTESTTVFSLTTYNGELIATGTALWYSPTMSGTGDLRGIARWNGVNWLPLGGGLSGNSENGGDGGRGMAVYNGSLYVGGVFSSAGGVAASRVARWNGSAWTALGSGMEGTGYSDVRAFFGFRGELLVGGNFVTAGGQPSGFFARWTTTNTPWVAMAAPVDRVVCESNDAAFEVVPATGYVTTTRWQQEISPGSGVFADLSDGPSQESPQTTIVGSGTNRLEITSIGPGLNGLRYRALVANACGEALHDAGRILLRGDPTFDVQPDSVATCVGEPVELSVSVPGENIRFQWRFRGVGIPPSINPTAVTATLVIAATTEADAGDYDCMVANECDLTAISDLVSLSFCACLECPADFNQDGGIDGGDVEGFFAAWEAGSCDADVNADGGVDGADVDFFFGAWEAGGC
ncbi:MAG: hypothetical protein JNK25_12230 [Phycisphaerae bacterium]|nr:hypothetical protein [Phycisphaerae bacterium]